MHYVPQTLEMRNYIRKQATSRDSVKDKDIMIASVACCTPEHTVRQAAEMMVRHDCGEIAIVKSVEKLESDWRDHRPRHCMACGGGGQKPSGNERTRCYGKQTVTFTPEPFCGALALGSNGVQ